MLQLWDQGFKEFCGSGSRLLRGQGFRFGLFVLGFRVSSIVLLIGIPQDFALYPKDMRTTYDRCVGSFEQFLERRWSFLNNVEP